MLRQDELRQHLAALERQVAQACLDASRDRDDVTVVVVTKTYPASDAIALVELGVRDLGESRDQEASAKADAVAAVCSPQKAPRWHFIGRLQSNKAHHVGRYCDLVHSLDRASLVAPLGRGAREHDRTVGVLIQVSLDGDPSRGGVAPDDLGDLARRVRDEPGLALRGVMAVAPLGIAPDVAFAPLRGFRDVVQAVDGDAQLISAGMSGDLREAIAAGATHLRVGTAVLGSRQSLQ